MDTQPSTLYEALRALLQRADEGQHGVSKRDLRALLNAHPEPAPAMDLPAWCRCPDDCDCDGVLVPVQKSASRPVVDREALAKALRQYEAGAAFTDDPWLTQADRLVRSALFQDAATVRQEAAAMAWDEGYKARDDWARDADERFTVNPYRAAALGGES